MAQPKAIISHQNLHISTLDNPAMNIPEEKKGNAKSLDNFSKNNKKII
jgi:hypothetical protein